MSPVKGKRISIILPEKFRQDISALYKAYTQAGVDVISCLYNSIPPDSQEIQKMTENADAALLIYESKRSPSNVFSSPFVYRVSGEMIPLGIFPVKTREHIECFANTVKTVHNRSSSQSALVLLSQRHPRYRNVANRMEVVLSRIRKTEAFRWTGERVYKKDMLAGLKAGPGCVVYLGHGRPVGWAGYCGTRMHDFTPETSSPMGCVYSLCCDTASRRRVSLSFSEALVQKGLSASSFGAVCKSLHLDNTRWAIRMCREIATVKSSGELLVRCAPVSKNSAQPYRLIGDPLAPLYSTAEAIKAGSLVPVYP